MTPFKQRNPTSNFKSRVGIIGDGRVGSALKRGLENSGYEVRAVGNNPVRVAEIAKWGEVVVLAVPYAAINETLKEIGEGVDGKILIDVTNVITEGGPLSEHSTSGAERLQKRVPNAVVVKAFNTVFATHMNNGSAKGRQLTLLVAGDSASAKTRVMDIGRDIGFDPVDAGPLPNARLLESLGNLNIDLGLKLGMGTDIGFALVH